MGRTISTIFFIFTFCAFVFGQNSNCPKVSVLGPSSVTMPGETATFSVSVIGDSSSDLEYIWSVSSGEIVEGQRTETITVKTTSDPTVTATIKVKGLPEGCENTASEASFYCPRPSPSMLDEFEISSRINSARLDDLISELEKNPNDSAYFIIYRHEKDSAKKLKGRENYLRNYLRAKKIEPKRFVIVTVGGDGYDLEDSVIRIWRVPPGAEPPTP